MLHVSCTLATQNIEDFLCYDLSGAFGLAQVTLQKQSIEVYGGPRYRCERGVKRPSREKLGTTLVSVAKLLAEQHFVVFFPLST